MTFRCTRLWPSAAMVSSSHGCSLVSDLSCLLISERSAHALRPFCFLFFWAAYTPIYRVCVKDFFFFFISYVSFLAPVWNWDHTFWLIALTLRGLCLWTGSLHGASASAQLSRLIWLYLHSGEQLYMEGVKQTVLQYVHTRLAISTSVLSADFWQPVLRSASPWTGGLFQADFNSTFFLGYRVFLYSFYTCRFFLFIFFKSILWLLRVAVDFWDCSWFLLCDGLGCGSEPHTLNLILCVHHVNIFTTMSLRSRCLSYAVWTFGMYLNRMHECWILLCFYLIW